MGFSLVSSLVALVALGFQAADSTEAAGPVSGVSAPRETVSKRPSGEPIATRQTLFSIPFTIDRPANPSEEPGNVQLYVSTNRGVAWRLYASVEPSRRQFLFRAGGDGPYWFQVRTLDRSGRIKPQPAGAGLLRVVVDTTRPRMELSARRGDAGQVIARWRIDERHPNPDSLMIHYRVGPDGAWQPVAIGQENRRVSGTVETNEVTFWPKAAGEIQIRAEVTDAAGNRAVCHAQVKTGQTAAKQPLRNSQETESIWRGGAHQAATPWPAEGTPSGKKQPGSRHQARGLPGNDPEKRKLVPTVEHLKPDPAMGPVAGRVHPPIQKQYASASPEASPEAAAGLPPGERPRMINKRLFELEYDNDMSGRGFSHIELWGSQDGGRTWRSFAFDDDNRSPVSVVVEEEGLYGFRVVASSVGNARPNPPKPGTPPEIFIGVDLTKPTARITGAESAAGADAGNLMISWEAADRFLARRPVSLSFSQYPCGPWTVIASGLENTGSYTWAVDPRVPQSIYLRLEVCDEAGNVGTHETSHPVLLEHTRASVRIRGVRPVGRENRSAAARYPFW